MGEHRIFYYSSCRPTQRSHSYITDSCFSLNWFPHSVQTFSTICLFCSVFFFIVYSPIRFLWFAVLIQQLFLRLIYNSVVRFVTLFRRNLLFCDRIQKSATNEGIIKNENKNGMSISWHTISRLFTSSIHILLQLRWWQELRQTPSIAYYPAFLVYCPISAWINASFLVVSPSLISFPFCLRIKHHIFVYKQNKNLHVLFKLIFFQCYCKIAKCSITT